MVNKPKVGFANRRTFNVPTITMLLINNYFHGRACYPRAIRIHEIQLTQQAFNNETHFIVSESDRNVKCYRTFELLTTIWGLQTFMASGEKLSVGRTLLFTCHNLRHTRPISPVIRPSATSLFATFPLTSKIGLLFNW